jgi:hypothetical protein
LDLPELAGGRNVGAGRSGAVLDNEVGAVLQGGDPRMTLSSVNRSRTGGRSAGAGLVLVSARPGCGPLPADVVPLGFVPQAGQDGFMAPSGLR